MKRVQIFGATVSIVLLMAGVCRGSVDVTIAWNPSSTDINGNALSTDVGYKLFYSDSSGVYSQCVDAGSATMASVSGLEYNKTYFFRTKAYTASGESVYSEEFSWRAPVMPDADADGISDSWELGNFHSLDMAQSMTDCDGDGVCDLNEFLAGTNPDDPNESPRIAIRSDSYGAKLSFLAKRASGDGYENRSRYYTVMQCEDLSAGIWTAVPGLEDIPAADQLVSCDVSSASRNIFYCTKIRLD